MGAHSNLPCPGRQRHWLQKCRGRGCLCSTDRDHTAPRSADIGTFRSQSRDAGAPPLPPWPPSFRQIAPEGLDLAGQGIGPPCVSVAVDGAGRKVTATIAAKAVRKVVSVLADQGPEPGAIVLQGRWPPTTR